MSQPSFSGNRIGGEPSCVCGTPFKARLIRGRVCAGRHPVCGRPGRHPGCGGVGRGRHPISSAFLGRSQRCGDKDRDGSHRGCPRNMLKHGHHASPVLKRLYRRPSLAGFGDRMWPPHPGMSPLRSQGPGFTTNSCRTRSGWIERGFAEDLRPGGARTFPFRAVPARERVECSALRSYSSKEGPSRTLSG